MPPSRQQLHRLDASGVPGLPGNHGSDGFQNHDGSSGQSGLQGHAAGPGGRIFLTASLPQPGKLLLAGEALCPRVEGTATLPRSLDVESLGAVQLLAQGGPGGRGGDGGDGARGATGFSGSDATRYSSGGDGGRGGDGGDGGAAGRGGAGGDGGTIHLRLAPEDLDLALLFEWDVSGGEGGSPGAPGAGGAGGYGGEGGDSYSWTENESYTDAQGNSQTRTVSRSNPGGSRGPSGSDGLSGASAAPGPSGAPGNFSLEVAGRSFSDRYRLECAGYRISSSQRDCLLEFGERENRVEGVLLRNTAELFSPGQFVELRLGPRPGVLPHPVAVPVPSLARGPGQSLEGLTFDLEEAPTESLPSLHERLRRQVWIEPEVHFPRLNRIAPEAGRPTEIEVTFPVELETLSSPPSLMPGQMIQQRWVVRNLSRFEFPTSGRRLTVELSKPSGESHLRVYGEGGEVLALGPEPTTYVEIEPLPPGGERTVTVYLSFEDGTPPYSAVEIWAALRLTPRYGGEAREVQRNPVSYSAALAYRGDNADVLLVTHSANTAEEVKEWGETLDRLGLVWDVWDAAWHGDLPILRLAEKVTGKLVVVLNVTFQGPDRSSVYPSDLMDLEEFREAVSAHGLSFYLVGSRRELYQRLVPQGDGFREFSSVGEFLDSFEPRSGPNPEVPESMTTSLSQVKISRFHVAADPEPKDLEAQAKALLETLRETYPDRRFAISSHFQPAGDDGWFRKRTYGYLRIRQLPDADARAVIEREVHRATGQKPNFIRSAENLLGVFSAMDFDDKMALARSLDEGRKFVVEPLADAWLLDLGEEQMVLRRSRVHNSRRRIREILNRTRDLCHFDFRSGGTSLDAESPLGRLLIRLAAGLSFLARARLHWSDHRIRLLGGTNEVEISEVVDELVDRLLDINFGADRLLGRAPEARKKADALIAARCEQLEAAAAAVESSAGGNLSRKDSAVEALVRWDLRDYLESDGALADGLLSEQALRAMVAAEQEARALRERLRTNFQAATAAGQLPDTAPFPQAVQPDLRMAAKSPCGLEERGFSG